MTASVLVVEDDEDIVYNIRTILEGEGYHVDAASNGRAALALLERTPRMPTVILLDLMMPVMNGAEFRRTLLADPRFAAIPVVLMTASGHIKQRTAELGVEAVIAKPFGIDELVGAVRRFAGGARGQT